MKQVLMENAFEAWAAAIRFCDDIKNGKATLYYQKNFVSSLHNAIELIMKQMLLNNNDHKVATLKSVKNDVEAKLLLDYFEAKNLNKFFKELDNDNLSKFYTIQFNELISLHKNLFGCCLAPNESFKTELKLLQQLRNNETHFLICQDSFLSEKDFCVLHNFMIRFYRIMYEWVPNNKDDYEMYILPYWGKPVGADSIYSFDRTPLQNFSYKAAVINSKWAKKIAALLNENRIYSAPDFSPYTITKDLVEEKPELSSYFEELWEMVYMMQNLEMISVDEILDNETGCVYFLMNVLL